MARYDKYDPYNGGTRAKLAANWLEEDVDKVFGVGLDAAGKVVKGAGTSGMIGVLVLTYAHKVNDGQIDVMTDGDIVDFGPTSGTPGTDFGVPGTKYYADATTGAINATAAAGKYEVGFTVEKDRLVVRFNHVPVPA